MAQPSPPISQTIRHSVSDTGWTDRRGSLASAMPARRLFAGSLEPGMARELMERKLARLAETGARVVAAANPGCLLQIAWGCRERGLDVTIVHPVELLARAADAYQD